MAGIVLARKVKANRVVDPVVRKTQMPSANLESHDPTAEIDWPVQISMNPRNFKSMLVTSPARLQPGERKSA